MDATFEQIFLALAVKKAWLAKEAALRLLTGYRNEQASRETLTLGEYLTSQNVLDPAQVEELVKDARRYILQGAPKAAASGDESAGGSEEPSAEKPPSRGGAGEVVPGYRISGKLGVGGMATIFRAAPTSGEGPEVALKILHPKKSVDARQRERFLHEAKLLTEFDHPNLVKGLSYGNHNGLHYFAMELVDGRSLQEVIDAERTLPETRALEIIVEVAKALQYMHDRGYVHKDIKPGNIMLDGGSRVKLCDLGFSQPLPAAADAADAEAPQEDAADGEEYTSGTVQFMSPEQAQGKRNVDIRSDIYSLGATLYYMILGELPFQGENDMDTMAMHVMEEINSSQIKAREISQHMHYFIERMMSKDKELRYQTPQALIEDVTGQLEGLRRVQEMHRMQRLSAQGADSGTQPASRRPMKTPVPRTRFSRLGRSTDPKRGGGRIDRRRS